MSATPLDIPVVHCKQGPCVFNKACLVRYRSFCVIDLALLYVMFSCAFFTFPYGVLGSVLFFIVSIIDLCLLSYFVE